ncbi:cilia- and flagella-associated protein 91 [Carcharodon carcharias]|uniref:cilia- and flagella-associated protein 91 n=1 Tax=Carcharodon carcharias TaxID=13397 RepID=UPI001B7DC339|nr:cilia- and flagella-associated protein 91 [Carcharodon carcharias]
MSFTVSQSLQEKQRFKPERAHDYIYDPLYSVASEKDHAKMSMKAFTSVNRLKRVPDYKTMFSNLQRFPSYTFQLDRNDPVPKFVDQRWKGCGERKQEAIKHLAAHDPSLKMQLQIQQDPQVSGKNRYKYFTRPVIPFVQHIPVNTILDVPKGSSPTNFEELNDQFVPLRTVGVQTDYRDSETQTEPYSPEYVVRPGSAPELLTLAALKFGRGLPAGLAEVEMIERARAKRAWEATLPPLSDHSQHEKRKKMMEAMERNEWAFREQEIEKLQEIRLDVLMNLLSQREAKQQEMNVKRVDAIWSKLQQKKGMAIKKIRLEHIKEIRKLTAKRRNVEGTLERRSLIQDYANYGSQVYAPISRIGHFPDQNSERFIVKSHFLSTFNGILELEEALPDFVTQPRIQIRRPRNTTKDGLLKYAARREMELAKIHKAIREARFKGEKPEKPLRFLFKILKPVPRPPTPTVEPPSEGEEENYLAIIYLQKLIRGRTVQNMMFEGKEKRIELIQELRTTHALQEDRQLLKQAEMQAILALQHEQHLKQQKHSTMDDYLSHIEGRVLADMFDFLNKELLRLQEERRIHAIVMLAERRRRIREAEESGLRQVEERRRREEDEIFKEVVKVHQTTVDSYLEDILLKSVQDTAEDQARQEICKMADEINDIAYEIEQHRTHLQSEEIVSELVHSFLIPEVHKIIMRDRVKQFQSRHLLVAHHIIHNEAERIMTDAAPSVSPSSSAAADVMNQALNEVEKEMKKTYGS